MRKTIRLLDKLAEIGELMVDVHCYVCDRQQRVASDKITLYSFGRRPQNVFNTSERCEKCGKVMVWIQGD